MERRFLQDLGSDYGAEPSLLKVGEHIRIGERSYEIQRVSQAKDLGAEFGFVIPEAVPIYWLAGVGDRQRGAYVPEKKIVLFFENTDRETQHHELVHVVEYFQEKRPGLLVFYEQVKEVVTENSFGDEFVSFNFRKNIHEFIADGCTKPAFIQALKKEGLYDRFLEETAYLFEKVA